MAQFIEQHPDFVILHPKSQGSALEWPTEKYAALSNLLNKEGIAVAFTGTEKEGVAFRGYLPGSEMVIDTSGLLTLEQLMTSSPGTLENFYNYQQGSVIYMKTDMASAFGVLITYQDTDGD